MVIYSKSIIFLLPYIKNIMEEEKIFFGMQPLTLISLLQTHPLNNNESTMYYEILKPSFQYHGKLYKQDQRILKRVYIKY